MKSYIRALHTTCLLSLALIFSNPIFAWNESGHRQTALIAYELLDTAARQKVLSLIKHHPRYQKDFIKQAPKNYSKWKTADQERWLFSQIAVWPDVIRREKNEEKKSKFHRGKWHYINLPVFPTSAMETSYRNPKNNLSRNTNRLSKNLNIIQVLNYVSERFKSGNSSVPKSVLVCWLFHLVGDIHQPLHSSALFTERKFKRGDLGGNAISVGKSNLHQVWDQAAGRSTHLSTLKSKAIKLTSVSDSSAPTISQLRNVGRSAAAHLEFETWLLESHALAKNEVYGQIISDKKTISALVQEFQHSKNRFLRISMEESYESNMKAVAEQRIVEAGYRLAGLINSGDYF